jgi:uncharacterized protein YbjT (DUF2867 family)
MLLVTSATGHVGRELAHELDRLGAEYRIPGRDLARAAGSQRLTLLLIDPADIAAVAALALTQDGRQGQQYLLTGSQAFTVAEQVGILAAAFSY